MRNVLLVVMLTLVSAGAVAQEAGFEVTPFLAYRTGGQIRAEDADLLTTDVDVDSSDAYGLMVDIGLTRELQIELLASRQSTELVTNDDLFSAGEALFDVDVTYYHVGLLYQWLPGRVRPYMVGSVGIGQLDIDFPGVRKADEFSSSLGGGVKVFLNEHVGFRLDGRFYWTDTAKNDWDWEDCEDEECWHGDWNNGLDQGEVKVGVVIAF